MNVLAASKLFVEQIRNTRSPLTAETYRHSVNAFVRHVRPETECSALGLDDFMSFISTALKGTYAKSTIGLYAVVIRNFAKFLVAEGLVQLDYTSFLKIDYALDGCRSDRPPRQPKVPTDADVQAIMQAAYALGLGPPLLQRNVAVVETLYCTGCRICEICGLTVGDIDLATGQATIIGKGRRVRRAYLSPRALGALRHYWQVRGDQSPGAPAFARHDDGAGRSKPLQPVATAGLRNAINRLALAAGIQDFTCHSFRHFYATKLLRETGNLAIVQDALGHARPDTTRVYARLAPETVQQAVRQVFNASPVQLPAETATTTLPAP